MASKLGASLLEAFLGKYLELSEFSVGSQIHAKDVRIRESAFTDLLGLPIKCVHGKVSKLVVKIPWLNLFTKSTIIEIEGVHLLVVPSTSVKYDEAKEKQQELEAKQKRLQMAEEAKRLSQEAQEADKGDGAEDTFFQRLLVNVLKNLEVTIRNVHIRYEDGQTNSSGYPFATGVTLENLSMTTTTSSDDGKLKLKIFEKHLVLNSLAVYWKPKANLFSSEKLSHGADVIDLMFDSAIGTVEKPAAKLMYLLGPISSDARLNLCLNPEKSNFQVPQVKVDIQMPELGLSLSKYQFHDFMLLLQALEYMSRASSFRKYKARHDLENLPNYQGRTRDLWKFAFDCVYEEEVIRRLNNWSWQHMKEHIDLCKKYRTAYKKKLTNPKSANLLESELRKYEDELDDVNIRIQRQLAEREVKKDEIQKEKDKDKAKGGGGFMGWLWGSKSSAAADDANTLTKTVKKLEEAMTEDEKKQLFTAIDYQENAGLSNFPKSFVANRLSFKLTRLTITIKDDDLKNSEILKLTLFEVTSAVTQRPSAKNVKLSMAMSSLTVTGWPTNGKPGPVIVSTRSGLKDDKLLKFECESNPPSSPDGNLDEDLGSLYDKRIRLFSSPLEIIYNHRTVMHLVSIFKTPDEVNLHNLQQTAFAKLRQYREATALTLQHVIDTHHLIDVDIHLMSSYLVVPHGGVFTETCACAIANLGSISVKSKPISAETRSLKDMSLTDLTQAFKSSLRDQVYDKFIVSLENMQVMVSLPNENWRAEIGKRVSPLFLLKPTSVKVVLQFCLITNDPELPLCKVNGTLDKIAINIADYRLVRLAQIFDSLFESSPEDEKSLQRSESEESMASALSSFANTGSIMSSNLKPASAIVIAPAINELPQQPLVQITQLKVDFKIDKVEFSLSQLKKHSNVDEEIFHFVMMSMKAEAKIRTHDLVGNFSMGAITCSHLLAKFDILETPKSDDVDSSLLTVAYLDVNKKSPDFATVHGSVMKRIDVKFKSVNIIVHQDLIMDLVDKMNKLTEEVTSKSRNLVQMGGAVDDGAKVPRTPEIPRTPRKAQNQRVSVIKAAELAVEHRPPDVRYRRQKSGEAEIVQFRVNAMLESAKFRLMTTKVPALLTLTVRNLKATFSQTQNRKELTAGLEHVNILDDAGASNGSLYHVIAENADTNQGVFDLKVILYDFVDPELKSKDPDVVDIVVTAALRQIRFVFLMKFVNDLVAFAEPFTAAKEVVVEKASGALEGAAKTVIDAYVNAVRVKLDVRVEAPLIIVPVNSKSQSNFLADLGTLTLTNSFSLDSGRIFDEMHFTLRELQFTRALNSESNDSNDVVSQCHLVKPITFELHIRRNMSGSMKKGDPAEISISGTLYRIEVEISKGDFAVLMAVTENFGEKGAFQTAKASTASASVANDRSAMTLPISVKPKYSGSRTSLVSNSSLLGAMKVPDRDPEVKAVEFSIKLRGLSIEFFTGDTTLNAPVGSRARELSLARIGVELLSVDGYMLVSSAMRAEASLENLVMDDRRYNSGDQKNPNRIVRLMEAKNIKKSETRRMVDISFIMDASGNANVDMTVHSFSLVVSVNLLLELGEFFIPDDNKAPVETKSDVPDVSSTPSASKITLYVKIEEPDIFLVENLEDFNSDAVVLNCELQLKLWHAAGKFSLIATLENVRCHTCCFNPDKRKDTNIQILRPFVLAFTVSQPDGHGIRVNVNIGDLCFSISPRSIEIIQNSIQALLASLAQDELNDSSSSESVDDLSDLWLTKPFKENQFWFFKEDETEEAIEVSTDGQSLASQDQIVSGDEQAIIHINNLVIMVVSGSGNHAIPLMLLESRFNCDVRGWSGSRMSAIGSMNLEIAYYNSKLALWEPVLEPIVTVLPDGSSIKKRWELMIAMQKNGDSDYGSAFVSPSFDEADGFVVPEHMPPLTSLTFQSSDVLQLTVTKSFLGVLNTLTQSFTEIGDKSREDKRKIEAAPLVVKNSLGKPITVILDNRNFKYFVHGEEPGSRTEVKIEHDSEAYLVLTRDRSHSFEDEYISPLQEQTDTAEATLRIRVGGERGTFEIPVSKADQRFFPFNFRGDESGDHHGMVSEVQVVSGSKFITFRSIIQIKNHFSSTINIFTFDGVSKFKKLASVIQDQIYDVPLQDVYSPPHEFYFQVDGEGENMGLESFCWKRLQDQPSWQQQVQCTNTKGRPDIYIMVDGQRDDILLERTGSLASPTFTLDIRPLFVLKNCLPVTLHYTVGSQEQGFIEPGASGHLHGIRFGHTVTTFKIFEFRSTDWTSVQVMEADMPELTTWRFVSNPDGAGNQVKMELGVNAITSRGTLVISIYAPFWMVNKTGKMLTYKGSDGESHIYHPVELESIPMMFSFSAKSFLKKRKASLRVEDSSWSEAFTLDTIEDAGKVTCKTTSRKKNSSGYNVGVNINMSKSSLTKIITFTPFYMIHNTLDVPAIAWELDAVDHEKEMVEIGPGQMSPFWPNFGAEAVVVHIGDSTTAPFTMRTAHSTLLMLGNKVGGVFVECRTSNSETLVTLSPYRRGNAPVQLINHTKNFMIEYSEKNNQGRSFLAPGESVYYTWIKPQGDRALIWSLSGHSEELQNPLLTDDRGIVPVGQNRFVSWVSFLDGMQRILLFTEDANLCYSLANTTGQNERIEQEIDVSIFGVGVSLVNNSYGGNDNCEILHMSISSSDIIWEIRRKGKTRYKQLTQAECQALEEDYQFYNRERSVCKQVDETRTIDVPASGLKLKVSYAESKMISPYEGRLRRQFQKGLWLELRSSTHQRQIHAKINRIQIDNQLSDCLFPVTLAPVPPPKSVVANSIPKPLMELSILEYKTPEHTNIRQFKYIHALVQELHIKIDQGLLNAIMELMEEEEILDVNIHEFLKEDLALARRPLAEVATLKASQGRRDFFDNLHLSPLKVHVSFSLTSYDSSNRSNMRSNFLSWFFQSLGVTITDTDDIVFRLAYFERKHSFYSVEDLTTEMIRHYTSQAIRQAYVVIFGLDVIGNPFGLVVGVSRSIEDFFYEPFQGAVEGPSEFAEGVVIGVRSVFSGVVGGAAGTVSRITGALGKGLANLTLDEKFKSKRLEGIKMRSRQNFGESLARGGKGVVMGIFDGVTGIATKPIEGAREEGVGGFFKGVGKGVVGLVARPTGGIIDFASGTFDSVKRVAEVTEEVHRVRPPRFLSQDGVVRYFNLKEATGNKLLKDLQKGRYAETDVYVTHDDISSDRASVLMVTNARIMFLVYQSVLGNWAIEWEFGLGEISGPPPCGKEDGSDKWYIIIKPKEEKRKIFGIFGGGESGKRVFLPSRDRVRQLARIIEELRTAHKN